MKSQMPPQSQGAPDKFYTPPKVLDPLVPLLDKKWVIWECAAGQGNLVRGLQERGYAVNGTDIDSEIQPLDFLTQKLAYFDAIVTNPPYSIKDKFIARCYEFGKPWALLLPVASLGAQGRQNMYRKHGLQIIMLGGRVQFLKPPATGAWQEHAWFTWGLNLPHDLTFAQLGAK